MLTLKIHMYIYVIIIFYHPLDSCGGHGMIKCSQINFLMDLGGLYFLGFAGTYTCTTDVYT